MVKVVVLDVDGTLMDTNYLHTEAWVFERVAVCEDCADLLDTDSCRHQVLLVDACAFGFSLEEERRDVGGCDGGLPVPINPVLPDA